MNPDYELTQSDVPDPLVATLLDATAVAVDLTTATAVAFHLVDISGVPVALAGTTSIVSAAAGKVQYAWIAADTAAVGYFFGEFQATFPGGKIVSFPTDPKILIRITSQLG